MTDKQRFFTALTALAKACGFELNPQLVGFYDSALSPFGYGRIADAITEIIVSRRGTDRMPSIGDIRAMLEPTNTVDGAAQELLNRVIQAVHDYGYVDPESAREFMGEVAWAALPNQYGWEEFCCEAVPLGIARSQLRDRIAARLRQENPNGRVKLPPAKRPAFKTVVYLEPTPAEKNRDRQLALLKNLLPFKTKPEETT